MATVTKTFSGYTTHYLQLDVNDNGVYSSETNSSQITYKVTLNKVSTSSGAWTERAYPAKFYVDNELKASKNVVYDVRNTLSQTLLEGTLDIKHDSTGKKTITCYASYTTSGNLGSATTPNLQLTLVTIPLNETIYIKVNSEYKTGYPYVKVNGQWIKSNKKYVKVNGQWRESVTYV